MNAAFHIEYTKRWSLFIGMVALLLVISACTGDPDENNQNQIIPEHDVVDEDTPGDGDADVADAGPDADAGSGVEDTGVDADVEEPEEDVEEIDHCAPYVDLGLLGHGEYPVTIDFTQEPAQWSTRCENESDGSSVMIAMELPTFSVVHVELDSALGVEMRFGDCGRATSRYMCDTDEFAIPTGFGAPQGYLILEALDDLVPDQVEVMVTVAQGPICEEDEGQSECVDADTARVCRVSVSSPDVPRWEEGQCARGCEEGQCLGDSCSAPLSMSSGEILTFNNLGLRDRHTEYEGVGCSLPGGDDDNGLVLRGRELVIELTALVEGDQVGIDLDVTGLINWAHEPVELDGLVVATIKDDCAVESACLAVWDDFEDRFHFEVPADGDYLLVIESVNRFDGQIEVAVEIN